MLEDIRIAEAYESMYSGGRCNVNEAAIPSGMIGKFMTKSTAKAIGKGVARSAGKAVAKSKPLLIKAVKGGVKQTKNAVDAVKKAGSVKGVVKNGLKAGAKAGVNAVKKSKAVQRIAKVAGRFAAKHPIIAWTLKKVAWPGFMFLMGASKSLVVGICEKAAKLLRTVDNIITGYGTKRLTSFLGEADGGNEDADLERFSEFAKTQLSSQEREAMLTLFTETKKVEGEPVDLSELTDENKDSIIGSMLMSLTRGITAKDGERAISEKIMANLEGTSVNGGDLTSSDGNVQKGEDGQNDGQTQEPDAEQTDAQGTEQNTEQNAEHAAVQDDTGDGEEDGGSGLTADELKQLKAMFKAAGL